MILLIFPSGVQSVQHVLQQAGGDGGQRHQLQVLPQGAEGTHKAPR